MDTVRNSVLLTDDLYAAVSRYLSYQQELRAAALRSACPESDSEERCADPRIVSKNYYQRMLPNSNEAEPDPQNVDTPSSEQSAPVPPHQMLFPVNTPEYWNTLDPQNPIVRQSQQTQRSMSAPATSPDDSRPCVRGNDEFCNTPSSHPHNFLGLQPNELYKHRTDQQSQTKDCSACPNRPPPMSYNMPGNPTTSYDHLRQQPTGQTDEKAASVSYANWMQLQKQQQQQQQQQKQQFEPYNTWQRGDASFTDFEPGLNSTMIAAPCGQPRQQQQPVQQQPCGQPRQQQQQPMQQQQQQQLPCGQLRQQKMQQPPCGQPRQQQQQQVCGQPRQQEQQQVCGQPRQQEQQQVCGQPRQQQQQQLQQAQVQQQQQQPPPSFTSKTQCSRCLPQRPTPPPTTSQVQYPCQQRAQTSVDTQCPAQQRDLFDSYNDTTYMQLPSAQAQRPTCQRQVPQQPTNVTFGDQFMTRTCTNRPQPTVNVPNDNWPSTSQNAGYQTNIPISSCRSCSAHHDPSRVPVTINLTSPSSYTPSLNHHLYVDDSTPEERYVQRTNTLFFNALVLDQRCPGVIQNSLSGRENFNDYAFDIAFAGNIPEKPHPIDPISMIEALKLRIDYEREEILKKCPADQYSHDEEDGKKDGRNSKEKVRYYTGNDAKKREREKEKQTKRNSKRGSAAQEIDDIDRHFSSKNRSEVNDGVMAFLKAENYFKNGPGIMYRNFSADIHSHSSNFFGLPIQMKVYNATTWPSE